jgi:hypothetical protein
VHPKGEIGRLRVARFAGIVVLKNLRGAFTAQLSHIAARTRKDEQFIHEQNWQNT